MEALIQAQDSQKSWISTPPEKCTLPTTQTLSKFWKVLFENTLGKENTCKNTISYECCPDCGFSSLLVKESGVGLKNTVS